MNLFKNIRRKLASENKTTAYLRYALGEILMLVIGSNCPARDMIWVEKSGPLFSTLCRQVLNMMRNRLKMHDPLA
jgi:hypothetical protein